MVDTCHPDLLYSDAPFNWKTVSYSMLANLYNGNLLHNKGKLEAIYNAKDGDSGGMYVEDLERSVKDKGSNVPWQTDTSIGDWFYREEQKYKSATEVIQMLVDIVSKNGNLLLNVVQTPEGDLEPDVLQILEEIAAWTTVNGEAIYGSRPWKVWGEKPEDQPAVKFEKYNNETKVKYSANDIRFTSNGNILYAFTLGTPIEGINITSLGKKSSDEVKAITSVKMLGSDEKLKWKQEDGALVISKPTKLPTWQVVTLKIEFEK